MTDAFDLIVVGGGPGGYVAAIRASQLGMKVVLVEKEENLGGTCLNIGCIPSKALLASSHNFYFAKNNFAEQGIKAEKLSVDLKKMMRRKDKVVADTVKGVDFLIKKNQVYRVKGAGKLVSPNSIEVTNKTGLSELYSAKSIIVATGSRATQLPGLGVDSQIVMTSTEALSMDTVPKTMLIVGAGAIGLEMASIWSRLGAEVTVVEYMENILFGMDEEISKLMLRIMKKQGLKFHLSHKVAGARIKGAKTEFLIESLDGENSQKILVEKALIAIGREPYTQGLGLQDLGVALDKKGFIVTDKNFRTNIDGLYAIGDVIGGPMLAHKASDEGVALVEFLAGQASSINYDAVPYIVYTWPELACVGKTEQQLNQSNIPFKTGKYPLSANARARITGDNEGIVKVLADARTDAILGVHIIGAAAGELIQECVGAIELGGSSEDLARTSHGHPGLGEAVKEAALSAHGMALHI